MLPDSVLKSLLKEAGAPRVSEEAVAVLREHLESVVRTLAKEGKVYAEHASRKTLRAEDIKLVLDKTTH